MRIIPLATALVLIAAPVAHAAVIYNDFGAGDSFDTTGGNTVSAFVNVGVRFVPTSSASVTDITVAMMATGVANVSLSVCADANGHPGAALASTTINVASGTAQVYHTTFAIPAALIAGTTYWIKAGPAIGPATGSPTWMFNNTGQFDYSATLPTGAWVASNGPTPALRLEDNSPPPLGGACCAGATCAVTFPTACNALNTRFSGIGTTCNPGGNNMSPCCKADFNQSGSITVQDVFDFLGAWFAGSGQADFNGSGLSVQDIFDFLNAWFAGC